MTKQELENYEPKGQLEGFPKEIIACMLDYQEKQGNKRDVTVFEGWITSGNSGFDWRDTKEKFDFWKQVISYKNFDLFFEKYPKKGKQDNPQDFRVGDKVYDILLQEVGVVQDILLLSSFPYGLKVEFKSSEKLYTLNGCDFEYKNPQLLHYQDGYDYNIIDFNNLPKRQETKRWRAEKEGVYNFVSFDNKDGFYSDDTKDYYTPFDDNDYNSGNYFRTEVEAEIIAQKMNTYFKQLIKEEHEHEKHERKQNN